MAYKPFKPGFAERVAKKAEDFVKPKIRSNQLRRSLYKKVDPEDPTKWALVVPQFWAAALHYGRERVTPKNATVLVWFRNPNNDPRLRGGLSPFTRAGVRRMSKADFQKWSAINREKIQRYKKLTGKRVLTSTEIQSLNLPMIVAKASGTTKFSKTKVYPFFSNNAGGGMQGFSQYVASEAKSAVPDHIRRSLQDAGLLGVEKTITVG